MFFMKNKKASNNGFKITQKYKQMFSTSKKIK